MKIKYRNKTQKIKNIIAINQKDGAIVLLQNISCKPHSSNTFTASEGTIILVA
jgi:hypothetical protein